MWDNPVPELDNQLKNTIKITLLVLLAVFIVLFFYPREGVIWGLVIGIITGIYNSVTLALRVKRIPDLSRSGAKSFLKKGIFIRLGMIMAVLFFVGQRLPFISLLAVGAGILVPIYVSVALAIVDSFKRNQQNKGLAGRAYNK